MLPTAIQVAGDLFRIHKNKDGINVYHEPDIIELLVRYDIPEPDFEGYAKISKAKGSRSLRNKKKLNAVSEKIKAAMKLQGITAKGLSKMAKRSLPEIYRWISAHNLTLLTVFEIESLLNIKLTDCE